MGEGKLLAIGEAHIAFTPLDIHDPLHTSINFIKEPGGSPVNVAVAAARHNAQVEFIGKIGKDPFGNYIKDLLPHYHVGTSYLTQTHLAPTHVFFKSQADQGERLQIQSTTAGGLLRPDDINKEWFNRGDILYFSSRPLAQDTSRGAIDRAVNFAGEKGVMVAFAPQFKPDEWPNGTLARETILHSIPYAHILILNEEELEFLTGKEDEYLAIQKLFGGKTKCMIIFRGSKGITYVTDREKGNIRYVMKDILDPSGINDAFIGFLLADFLMQPVTADQLSQYLKDVFYLEERLEQALIFREKNAQKRGSLIEINAMEDITIT